MRILFVSDQGVLMCITNVNYYYYFHYYYYYYINI